jgi:hypothetical protein
LPAFNAIDGENSSQMNLFFPQHICPATCLVKEGNRENDEEDPSAALHLEHLKMIGENRGQFQQHFTRGFLVQKFCAKPFCACSKDKTFYFCKNIVANALVKCW